VPNTYDLAGKTAVVTGAARGIGRAIAELPIASGCAVSIWDTNPADVLGAASVLVDVTDPTQIAETAAKLSPERVDILVNNAATWGGRSTSPTT
jgi:3-oxoacyl-[acyl-carrier protein] reductase